MFSYIALNDSRVVANAKLVIGAATLDFSDIDFGRFSVEQRKVLIGVGVEGDGPGPSSSLHSLAISSMSLSFEVTAQESPCLLISGDSIAMEDLTISEGSFNATIDVFLDIPMQQLDGQAAPKHIIDSFEYSQVLMVLVSISERAESDSYLSAKIQKPVCDGYGQFGFFLANLTAMDEFLKLKYGPGDIDLINELTTTELASELFDQGLMILVWGLTSWHYMIFALGSEREKCNVPTNPDPQYQGCYNLNSRLNEFSIVRGTELSSWNQCINKKWPTVILPGEGEQLKVEFHIKRFNPIGGSHGPAYPVVVMWRSAGTADLSPILEVDIDEAE
jgi:hypothetical protein